MGSSDERRSMQEPKPEPDALSTRNVAIFFVVCAAVDAAFGYVRGHSLTYVIGSIVVGPFGTAVLAFLYFLPRDCNSNRESN
jgi:hypothetical protein